MKIKQLFVGAAMVGLLGMVPSLARAEVSSAVIGMQEIEITTTWTLLGVSFFDMTDSSVSSISIQDFISGDFVEGDQIYVPRSSGSDYDIAAWNPTLSKWTDAGRRGPTNNESTLLLKAGEGVWLMKTDASTEAPKKVTTFGRVIVAPQVTVDFSNKWKLTSLPIFEDLSINSSKLVWTGLAHGDQVYVPRKTGSDYDIAMWDSDRAMWMGAGRRGPTSEVSTVVLRANIGAWMVSTSDSATCTYDGSKE